jgi:hypothetical protein
VTKLAFDIRNDSNNLYLVFEIPDQRTQFRIARAGMSLSIEAKTKPKRKKGIYFSPFISEKPGQHNRTESEKKGPSIIRQKYMLSPPDVMASGFAFSDGEISENKDIKKVAYFADWDSLNCMTVEFRIPLRELFGDNFDLRKVSEQEISMTLQENAFEKPAASGEGKGSGSGMGNPAGGTGGFQQNNGQGMGGQGGQGAGGEHQFGQPGSADRSAMFEPQVLKHKIRLNCNGK